MHSVRVVYLYVFFSDGLLAYISELTRVFLDLQFH